MATSGAQKHIFIIGAKSIAQYGGFEMFLDKLTEEHQRCAHLQYYIVTKANGYGHMDETKLSGAALIDDRTFLYHRARVVKLQVPPVGAAQAIAFDWQAMRFCLRYCKERRIPSPVFYILACRLGPLFHGLVKEAHELGGKVYINPDGHDWKRAKWNAAIRKYWKYSEEQMVRWADLVVCDSQHIEEYIQKEYAAHHPKTTFIAYGSDLKPSSLGDQDPTYMEWMAEKGIVPFRYYLTCCRLVPENSFEIMIREFLRSHTERDFVIIATRNDTYLEKLNQKLHFKKDPRIKFVGTVYDQELLKKIREKAYANFHGHTVGGTNPSLLEAMECTDVNLLVDVGFNREVAEEAALYWTGDEGDLSQMIERVDGMDPEERKALGDKAKARIREAYSWEKIGREYEELWMRS